MISSYDTETTGTDSFHGCRPWAIGACDGEYNHHWLGEVDPFSRNVYWKTQVLRDIQSYIDATDESIFHNKPFDLRMMEAIGLDISRLWKNGEDTHAMSHIICSADSHGLKDLYLKYGRVPSPSEFILDEAVKAERARVRPLGWQIAKEGHPHFPGLKSPQEWYKMDMWLCPDQAIPYMLNDCEATFYLYHAFMIEIQEQGWESLYEMRKRTQKIYYDMSSVGMRFEKERAVKYVKECQEEREQLRLQIKKESGITFKLDLDRKDHLLYLLRDKLKVDMRLSKKGKPSVNKDNLKLYAEDNPHPVLQLLTRYNLLKTKEGYVSSYTQWVADDEHIHGLFNAMGTRETRSTSNNPNLQNIDKKLWVYFLPEEGYIWLLIDLVNIELRIWAYETGNKELIAAFESGKSVHILISEALYDLGCEFFTGQSLAEIKLLKTDLDAFKESKVYTEFKSGTFKWLYGGNENGVNQVYFQTKSKTPPAGTTAIGKRFPEVVDYIKSVAPEVRKNLDNLLRPCIICRGGYPIDVPPGEEYKGANYRIQGAAGIVMMLCQIAVEDNPDYIRSLSRMFVNIHDMVGIKIPIHPLVQRTVYSIMDSVEQAGTAIIPTCTASYKIKYNPADKDNPYLKGLI